MKLQQGQVWKTDAEYIRVVKLERLAVDFKICEASQPQNGTHQRMTKKQFCRLIKSATLLSADEVKGLVQGISGSANDGVGAVS